MSDTSSSEKQAAIKQLAEVSARLVGEGRAFDGELIAEACRRCFGSYPPTGTAVEALVEFLIVRDRGEPVEPVG
jgi:hypothetical protein